tara:strand:+ start:260 stop:445 length:186 start_codon:yes stop_codon:yes gene_type:complete
MIQLKKIDGVSSDLIFASLLILILFLESIYILISYAWKGIWKKEILSSDSEIGFDVEIKIK